MKIATLGKNEFRMRIRVFTNVSLFIVGGTMKEVSIPL